MTYHKRPVIKNLTTNNEDDSGREDENHISARAGIRTRVKGVTVPHTGPDFTTQIMHFYTTRALQILSLPKPIKMFCFLSL